MMTRLRTVVTTSLIIAGAGETARVMAAPEPASGEMELALPVRKKADSETPPGASPARDEPTLAIPAPRSSAPSERPKAEVTKPAEADSAKPARASTASSKKKSEPVKRAKATPRRTPKPQEKKPVSTRAQASATPELRDEPLAESEPTESETAEASDLEKEMIVLAPPDWDALPPAPPPPPRQTPRRGMFSRALSAVLPGNSEAGTRPTPVSFNTDYRTRSANAIVPVAISGNGLGGRDIPIGSEDAYRKSLPSDFCPTDLVRISPELCLSSGQPIFLRREAGQSLERMFRDAAAQGLKLQIFSGYRDYGHQSRLYAEAVRKRGPNQKTVARPGRSEHFLGTTADVTNGQPRHLLSRSFASSPEGKWLEKNAGRYGWKMTVRAGGSRGSHNDEPWHIRYLGSSATTGGSSLQTAGAGRPSAPPARPSLVRRLGRFMGIGK